MTPASHVEPGDAAAVARAILGRRSVRRFRDEPVERSLVERLVELASWAPSAGNRQDWGFVAVTSRALKRAMADAVRREWRAIADANRGSGLVEDVERYSSRFGDFEAAPAVIVVLARPPDAAQRHLLGNAARATTGSAASAAMAAENLMLAAHAMGLGTCCMTGALAASDELGRLLALGKKEEIVCLVALGWPAETPSPPPRKPVGTILRFAD